MTATVTLAPKTVKFDNQLQVKLYLGVLEKTFPENYKSVNSTEKQVHFSESFLPLSIHRLIRCVTCQIYSEKQLTQKLSEQLELLEKGVAKMKKVIGRRVYAVKNADEDNVYLYGFGVLEGYEIPSGAVGDTAKLALQSGNLNPKITLDSGETVWGCEIWWGPENQFNQERKNVVNVNISHDRAKYTGTLN